jgi:hypothetical protein
MRFSFLAFTRALAILTVLFAPVVFGQQTEDCKIIDSPPPCIQSGINFAECASAGTCGTNCPTPPAPGPSWLNVINAIQGKVAQCAEDVVAVASTGKGYYDMFASRRAEGLYSGTSFFSGTRQKFCNFADQETGGFIGCSSCKTYSNTGPCSNVAQHPASCSTSANCIPNVCAVPSVTIFVQINNPCGDPFVLCGTRSEADALGVFGEGGCSLFGFNFLYGWGFTDCDGSTRGDFVQSPCPTF